jgi:hypothetical protein
MERFQAAKLLIDWFHQLPIHVQDWLVQAFWIAVPVLIIIIGWRLIRQEDTSESGRVTVKWFSPKTWPNRFIQLRDEGRAALPKDMQGFIEQVDKANEFAYKLQTLMLGCLLALLALLMGIMWLVSPLQGWWAGLIAGAAGYYAKRLLRRPKSATEPEENLD